jgi:membrane fusion protein
MPIETLYRQEAVEHRRRRLDGEVVLSAPISLQLFTGFLGITGLAIIALLIFGSFDRRETLSGWISPDTGLAHIFPPGSGVVDALLVSEGQPVVEGTALFSLSTDTDSGGNGPNTERVLTQLSTERTALEDQQSASVRSSLVRRREIEGRIQGLQAQRSHLIAELDIQDHRVSNAKQTLARLSDLSAQGYVSVLEQQRFADDFSSQKQHREELLRSRLETETNLATLRHQLQSLPIDLEQSLAAQRQQIADLNLRSAQSEHDRRLIARAPIAGTVTAVLARKGSFVSPARAEMTILPQGGVLQAVLYAPSRAAGLLRKGQQVKIQYDAFPFQQFGTGSGRIASVSRTILSPKDIEYPLSEPTPVYRVTVSIEQNVVRAYGDEFPLQAGMTLKADVVLERRRLWQLLFDPLLASARR